MSRTNILTFRLNETERDTLKRYATASKMTDSDIIRNALYQFINQNPQEDKRTWKTSR